MRPTASITRDRTTAPPLQGESTLRCLLIASHPRHDRPSPISRTSQAFRKGARLSSSSRILKTLEANRTAASHGRRSIRHGAAPAFEPHT